MHHPSRSQRVVPSWKNVGVSAAVVLLSLAAIACEDPTKGQAKAAATAPVASVAEAVVSGTSFAITPQGSTIEWTGSKVTGSHSGGFSAFSGVITVVGGAVEKSRVTVDIDTGSLTGTPDKLVGHLKSPDFLGVELFPKASFASTSIKVGGDKGAGYQISGNLTFHGVTKSISFPANISVGADAVNADATFSFNRKDFNITYPGKVDDLIRDDVLIKLTLHAAKQG
jgi:polyisoprenoid-binding protein YceI